PLIHDGVVPPSWHMLLGESIPLGHQLMGYYPNLFRDWAWGDEENSAALNLILGTKALSGAAPGTTAVLGAGAGRLAYDYHRAVGGTTIAVDINPLLLYAARRVCTGRNLTLYEFPLAPVDGDSVALKRQCSAP